MCLSMAFSASSGSLPAMARKMGMWSPPRRLPSGDRLVKKPVDDRYAWHLATVAVEYLRKGLDLLQVLCCGPHGCQASRLPLYSPSRDKYVQEVAGGVHLQLLQQGPGQGFTLSEGLQSLEMFPALCRKDPAMLTGSPRSVIERASDPAPIGSEAWHMMRSALKALSENSGLIAITWCPLST